MSKNFFVVGVGSSAGGLDALKQLIKNLQKDDQFCLIIQQHVSPDRKSRLFKILNSVSKWPVKKVEDKLKIKVQTIYIISYNHEITIDNDKIRLKKHEQDIHAAPSIDNFFQSLASAYRKQAMAVVLSGTGKDGSEGIAKIKENTGYVIAQEPEEASFPSMPRHAIQTGNVDKICLSHEIPQTIKSYIENYEVVNNHETEPKSSLDRIIELMANRTGTDFSQYKPSTIKRRIHKRLTDLHLENPNEYHELIQNSPMELEKLFQTVLIGVTEFFRDEKAFEELKEKIDTLIKKRYEDTENKSIRIWSVGCATGEEPYTIAMILAEILGEKFQAFNIQIFATDIDSQALSIARKGFYKSELVNNLSPNYLKKYFNKVNGGYEIKNFIRQPILFSKHDITMNPPFVRMDFITCRNLLIYFNTEVQRKVLPVFHYALNPGAFLLLGKSENVAHISNLFEKSTGENKIFKRKDDIKLNILKFNTYSRKFKYEQLKEPDERVEMSLEQMAEETLLRTYEHPYVILDSEMETIYVKGSLKPYLDLSEGAIHSNILKITTKDIHTELRTIFAKVKRKNKAHKSNIIRLHSSEKEYYTQLEIKPLLYRRNSQKYFMLIFVGIDPDERYPFRKDILEKAEYKNAIRIIELEQELEASREHLQNFTEELETSNEELQAMNEELQSANEELKSANEELETSNEELQSTNEELQTSNSDLNHANNQLLVKESELLNIEKDLRLMNQRFQTALSNSKIFVTYQDKDLKYVWAYNEQNYYKKEDLNGYSDEEVLEREEATDFVKLKKKVLKTKKAVEQDISHKGRYWNMKVRPWIQDDEFKGICVLAVDITEQIEALKKLDFKQSIINTLVKKNENYLMVVDLDGIIQIISEKLSTDISKRIGEKLNEGDNLEKIKQDKHLKKTITDHIERALEGKKVNVDLGEGILENTLHSPKYYYLQSHPLFGEEGQLMGASYILTEITDLMRSKVNIQEALKRSAHLIEEDYFKDLTLQLYELFGCEYNYVGVLTSNSERVETKAIRINGKLSRNFEYELTDVPCSVVNQQDCLQHFENVEEKFPNDPKLQRWDAESYVGIPISSPLTGEVLGIMVMISENKIELTEDAEYLLTILSLRAGGELVRQQNTQELMQRDKQLEKITRNSPSIIYEFIQYPDGNQAFTYVSQACLDVFEITPEKLKKNPAFAYDIIHEDDKKSFFELQEKNMNNPETVLWTGRIIPPKSKATKWIQIASRPEVLDNGDIIWYGIIEDISKQKSTESQLSKAKEEAEESAISKERFLATMSHEIRTPLNVILGIMELVKEQKDVSQIKEYLDILKFNTDNLLTLVNNILDFSKIEAGQIKFQSHPFDLRQLLVNLHKNSHIQAERKQVAVKLELDKNVPERVSGDQMVLSQILNNLLSNAIKFTHSGSITLSAKVKERTDRGYEIRFAVEDTGEGIAEEDLPVIFKNFEQGKDIKHGTGTGLGLSISKRLLNLLRTDISLETKVGDGSRFYFDLFLQKVTNKLDSIPAKVAKKTRKKISLNNKYKVLIAEDNQDNRHLLIKLLLLKGHFDMDECKNGLEALEAVQVNTYDLVLMDVRMPKMDGPEAAKKIRELEGNYFKKLPIIAITADYYGIHNESDFTDTISKPYTAAHLMTVLGKHLDLG